MGPLPFGQALDNHYQAFADRASASWPTWAASRAGSIFCRDLLIAELLYFRAGLYGAYGDVNADNGRRPSPIRRRRPMYLNHTGSMNLTA